MQLFCAGRRDAFEAQPVAAASDEKVKRAPVVSAPQRSRGKVLGTLFCQSFSVYDFSCLAISFVCWFRLQTYPFSSSWNIAVT